MHFAYCNVNNIIESYKCIKFKIHVGFLNSILKRTEHLGDQMRAMGPSTVPWCARYESKHRYLYFSYWRCI
jgi:hypothetical protein